MIKIISLILLAIFLQLETFGQENKLQSLFKIHFSNDSRITFKKELELIMSDENVTKSLQKFKNNYGKKLKTKLKNKVKLSKQDSLYLFHNIIYDAIIENQKKGIDNILKNDFEKKLWNDIVFKVNETQSKTINYQISSRIEKLNNDKEMKIIEFEQLFFQRILQSTYSKVIEQTLPKFENYSFFHRMFLNTFFENDYNFEIFSSFIGISQSNFTTIENESMLLHIMYTTNLKIRFALLHEFYHLLNRDSQKRYSIEQELKADNYAFSLIINSMIENNKNRKFSEAEKNFFLKNGIGEIEPNQEVIGNGIAMQDILYDMSTDALCDYRLYNVTGEALRKRISNLDSTTYKSYLANGSKSSLPFCNKIIEGLNKKAQNSLFYRFGRLVNNLIKEDSAANASSKEDEKLYDYLKTNGKLKFNKGIFPVTAFMFEDPTFLGFFYGINCLSDDNVNDAIDAFEASTVLKHPLASQSGRELSNLFLYLVYKKKKHDNVKALKYFNSAYQIAEFLPKSFYESLLFED